MPNVIYTDIKYLIEKIHNCETNQRTLSTKKIGKYISCRYSRPTIWACYHIAKKNYKS